MTASNVIAVLGVGPALGGAVARRFAREGFAAALLARRAEALAPIEASIVAAGGKALSITTDATSEASVDAAFERIRKELGPIDVFVYNAGAFAMGGILDITAAHFEQCWKANCMGGFLGAKQALPDMVKRGSGTILLTGATASMRGSPRFACLAVGKFGLRALAQSMAREFGPKGIHVAHIIIDGQIDPQRDRDAADAPQPRSMLAPEAIADVYWQLHGQDPTTWTFELDLRPSVEKF